jgi:hypothetical protein
MEAAEKCSRVILPNGKEYVVGHRVSSVNKWVFGTDDTPPFPSREYQLAEDGVLTGKRIIIPANGVLAIEEL